MKRALAFTLLLIASVIIFAFRPVPTYCGNVLIYKHWPSYYGVTGSPRSITISTWDSTNLIDNIDSALYNVRNDDVLFLSIPDCREADLARVKEVMGRFVAQSVTGIVPSGQIQWGKPLFLMMQDSLSCPWIFGLRERRWTKFIILDSPYISTEENADMVRRYKRERVDRMEEMFRK